jgi:putative PIN family toxin of toxin-antitoxin system
VLRVVLDANVFVSAYINPEGTPGQIIQSFLRNGSFELVLSEPIIAEVLEALAYPKVLKAARSKIEPALWFEDLVVLSQLIPDDIPVPRLSADPDDDPYIACAIASGARFLVTGEPDLLTVRQHEGVRIVRSGTRPSQLLSPSFRKSCSLGGGRHDASNQRRHEAASRDEPFLQDRSRSHPRWLTRRFDSRRSQISQCGGVDRTAANPKF